jgi:hypothetical protein
MPKFIPDRTWTLCNVHSQFLASFEHFQAELDSRTDYSKLHQSTANGEHDPSFHPGRESSTSASVASLVDDKQKAGAETTISLGQEEAGGRKLKERMRFLSVENLKSVSPVHRRLEEFPTPSLSPGMKKKKSGDQQTENQEDLDSQCFYGQLTDKVSLILTGVLFHCKQTI